MRQKLSKHSRTARLMPSKTKWGDKLTRWARHLQLATTRELLGVINASLDENFCLDAVVKWRRGDREPEPVTKARLDDLMEGRRPVKGLPRPFEPATTARARRRRKLPPPPGPGVEP